MTPSWAGLRDAGPRCGRGRVEGPGGMFHGPIDNGNSKVRESIGVIESQTLHG